MKDQPTAIDELLSSMPAEPILIRLEKAATHLCSKLDTLERGSEAEHTMRQRLYNIREHIHKMKLQAHIDELLSSLPAFRAFLDSDFAQSCFTPAIYRLLTSTFQFIAHFDRPTFYQTVWPNLPERLRTIQVMTDYEPRGPYHLVETAIQETLSERGVLARLTRENEARIEREERAELARLMAKFKIAGREETPPAGPPRKE